MRFHHYLIALAKCFCYAWEITRLRFVFPSHSATLRMPPLLPLCHHGFRLELLFLADRILLV